MDEIIKRNRLALQNPYAYLDGDGAFSAATVRTKQVTQTVQKGAVSSSFPIIVARELTDRIVAGRPIDRHKVEAVVRRLQIELWRRREGRLRGEEVLDPIKALRSIGYRVELHETLGDWSGDGAKFEIAGDIDSAKSLVRISRRFPPNVRRFTAAHELGHAVLGHRGMGLHRDRALDGMRLGEIRDQAEAEADRFAAYFLMPRKLVQRAFESRFLTQRFVVDEATAFALARTDVVSLQKRISTSRDLTRLLASAECFNGAFFVSLADHFGVSIESLAIRLEELDLVDKQGMGGFVRPRK